MKYIFQHLKFVNNMSNISFTKMTKCLNACNTFLSIFCIQSIASYKSRRFFFNQVVFSGLKQTSQDCTVTYQIPSNFSALNQIRPRIYNSHRAPFFICLFASQISFALHVEKLFISSACYNLFASRLKRVNYAKTGF